MGNKDTLPYRTTGEDLERFVSACARGRNMDQIRSLFTSNPNFQGTTSAAEVLGLYESEVGELTALGRSLANDGGTDEGRSALLSGVLGYEPYELLLEATFASGVSQEGEKIYTTLEWIESWWEDNGYGSSQTNRSEGSTAFAKIVSYLNLGEYKQGRHGHPSRIEWASGAENKLEEARIRSRRDKSLNQQEEKSTGRSDDSAERADVSVEEQTDNQLESPPENNTLTLNLSGDRVARLSLPPTLTPKEKKRLVSLVKLMVSTEDSGEAAHGDGTLES